jgi:hypothetical protein
MKKNRFRLLVAFFLMMCCTFGYAYQGMNKMETGICPQKTSPTAEVQTSLSQQGNIIVNYALNKDPKAWKNLYTANFKQAVNNVERKFFSNKNNMDMGCYRLFLDNLLRTTYINQRVANIRMKSAKATSATSGNIILEYTWEDDDIDGSIYHKQLRTLKMRKEQGKWLIDDIVIEGESSKKFFKNVINYDSFC